ncbi:MAG TPA: hypothetical protein PKK43_09605 [Spirochaetota bacterium]|nr:hypothetical protein [Spirochaetota bacterium]
MIGKILGFIIMLSICFLSTGGFVFASNLDYATNNGPEYFRNPAGRSSAQDSADIATNNPAGTIRMKEGFFVNISNQTVIKKYTVEDRSTGQDYESNEPDLLVPNLFLVWNPAKSNIGFWSHIGIIGGGGTLYYPDGAPVVNRVIAAGMAGVDAGAAGKASYNSGYNTYFSGLSADKFTTMAGMLSAYNIIKDKYHFSVRQQSYQICQSLGSTYSVTDNLSVAAGVRIIESRKTYGVYQSVGVDSADKFIDVKMNAFGAQGILGINYKPVQSLNLALTYETVGKMKYKVKVGSNGSDEWGTLSKSLTDALGMEDGKTYNYDMPHRFMSGMTYNVTSYLDVTLCGILYINDGFGVKIETGTDDEHSLRYMNKYSYEVGTGFDLKIMEQIVWSAGFVVDNMNQNTGYMNEVNYHPNAYIVNTGFMFLVNDKLNVSIGFGRNFFPDTDNDKNKAYNDEPGIAEPALTGSLGSLNAAMGGSELSRDLRFKKETWVTAVGAQYKL